MPDNTFGPIEQELLAEQVARRRAGQPTEDEVPPGLWSSAPRLNPATFPPVDVQTSVEVVPLSTRAEGAAAALIALEDRLHVLLQHDRIAPSDAHAKPGIMGGLAFAVEGIEGSVGRLQMLVAEVCAKVGAI